MPDDCTDKEPVVSYFCAHLHLSCPKIQVHLVISTWNGSEVKISHPVQLQLESQSRLKMTINTVLLKLSTRIRGKNRSHEAVAKLLYDCVDKTDS